MTPSPITEKSDSFKFPITSGPPHRNLLPKNLLAWRLIDDDLTESTWNELRPLIKYHGYELWEATYTLSSHKVPDELPAPGTCFLGANKVRNFCLVHLKCFLATNGMMHAARGAGNNDYILRVIKVNGEGARHLRILRRLSCSPDRLLASNHILPMVKEIHSQDIVIGVFPRTTYDLGDLLSRRRRNSVEDILHMVIQALEGVAYIHENIIAHRDLFLDNFVVEWSPESLDERGSITRPRVYLIDFETAVDFTKDSPPSSRRCTGAPWEDSGYNRRRAPEFLSNESYCPFRLDMWQFGTNLQEDFPTGLAEVDNLWEDLASTDPMNRPSAIEALTRLTRFVRNAPPASLHVRPQVEEEPGFGETF